MEENWNAKTCLSQDWGNLGENQNKTDIQSYCPPIWDGFSCWGPTPAGTTVSSRCPSFKGSDITKSALRTCSPSGEWLDRDGVPSPVGWTNYTPCLTPEIREIMRRLGSNDDAQIKFNIAENTRILEFVGLSLSLAALLLSLVIFYYFRTLRNSRTRLHRHLFIAMVIQVGIRLIVYTDQAITRTFDSDGNTNSSYHSRASSGVGDESTLNQRRGLDNTPILCEASYISLEYARTAMFMWMFVEGLFLHNMITVTVFEEKLSPLVYPIIGWILPIPLTVAWAIVTHFHYGSATCWWGYNFTLYFWILEGPRLAVLMVNLAFLLNILRVLVMKLRQSNSSETQQAMKAVKAALVLLPLLGLTNLLNMLDAPLEKSPLQFALWSYTTHLLTSTQGLILAFLYCFRNGEVQIAIRKFVRIHILGNSKHIIINKRPIPLSAMDNGSLYNAGNDSVGGSCSQTVNMVNPPTAHESTMIILPNGSTTGVTATTTFNEASHNYYHKLQNNNSNNNNRRFHNGRMVNSRNYNKAAISSPPGSVAHPPPAPLIVRSFSNGVLKQTSISRAVDQENSHHQKRHFPNNDKIAHKNHHHHSSHKNYPENQHLLHRNSSGCSDDLNGTRPLLYNRQQENIHENLPTTMTTSSSFQEQHVKPIIMPMTSSSSWCSSASSSSRNKELHSHHPSTSSSFQLEPHNQHDPNTNKGSKISQQIANSWRMLIIPEQLLKRMRGGGSGGEGQQQHQTSDLVSSSSKSQQAEASFTLEPSSLSPSSLQMSKQKKRLMSKSSNSVSCFGADGIVLKEDDEYGNNLEEVEQEISNSTDSTTGEHHDEDEDDEVDGVSMDFYSIEMSPDEESVGVIVNNGRRNNKTSLAGILGINNNGSEEVDNNGDCHNNDVTVQIEILKI